MAAFAVIVAGVLSLIVEPGNSDTTNGFSYLLLAILGVIGGLHSFRAAYHWDITSSTGLGPYGTLCHRISRKRHLQVTPDFSYDRYHGG